MPTPLVDLLESYIPTKNELSVYYFTADHKTASKATRSHCFVAIQRERIIYAIEVLAYERQHLTTLYVSKVDSTGCHDSASSPISGLTLAILTFVMNLVAGPTRLCLFARAQPQYIFPYSAKNASKHLLDDAQLVRWWIKISERVRSGLDESNGKGYLLIPGEDEIVSRRQIQHLSKWQIGHPYDVKALAVDEIISFPDDPKARFLEDLKGDKQDTTMKIAQFWEMMAYRQEMSFGHSIGFVVLDLSLADHKTTTTATKSDLSLKQYKKLYSELQSGLYATAEETKQSTSSWVQQADSMQIAAVAVIGQGSPTRHAGEQESQRQPDADARTEAKRKFEAQNVHLLVPRKKKVLTVKSDQVS